jgi:hypothetical protein
VANAVRATPDVAQVSISEVTPVSGMQDVYVEVEEPAAADAAAEHLVQERGDAGLVRAPVVIVNETFVRKFLRGSNPVGRRIRNPSPAPDEHRAWMEVVGVVADAWPGWFGDRFLRSGADARASTVPSSIGT